MIRVILVTLLFLVGLTVSGQSIRSIGGQNNNTANPQWGSEGDQLFQLTTPSFSDGISTMSGIDRPNPRVISNALFSQLESISDEQNLSDYVWAFGQFIDHDLIFVDNDLTAPLAIRIPEDDKVFSPEGPPIGMFRSRGMLGTGLSTDNVKVYANQITAFLDGSGIYGSSLSRANWLRTFEDGKLKTSEGNLLPWNTLTGQFNSPKDPNAPFMDDPVRTSPKHFVSGDIRANEAPTLIAFHTIFAREHNRISEEIKLEQSDLSDEEIYQKARKMVGGFIQSIVYNEWLPAMGVTLPSYNGYRDDVNPQISNVFSAAAYRMGHTLINSNVIRMEGDGTEISGGNITLKDAFFNPTAIILAGGVEPYLRGMAVQVQQKLDCKVIDDVRNFLFGDPANGGLDLASININRGRERGLLDFNALRGDIGLPLLRSFEELTDDVSVQEILTDLYSTIDNVDPWVGMLSEDYTANAMFGSTIMAVLEDQFQRLRDGDKFFFEADPVLTDREKSIIRQTTLRDIIMRNTDIKVMQTNIFKAIQRQDIVVGPDIEAIDLNAVAFPNPIPSSGELTIKIFAEEDYVVDIDIYNNLGNFITRQKVQLLEGDNNLAFSLGSALSSQFYNIVVRRGLRFQVLRVYRL